MMKENNKTILYLIIPDHIDHLLKFSSYSYQNGSFFKPEVGCVTMTWWKGVDGGWREGERWKREQRVQTSNHRS